MTWLSTRRRFSTQKTWYRSTDNFEHESQWIQYENPNISIWHFYQYQNIVFVNELNNFIFIPFSFFLFASNLINFTIPFMNLVSWNLFGVEMCKSKKWDIDIENNERRKFQRICSIPLKKNQMKTLKQLLKTALFGFIFESIAIHFSLNASPNVRQKLYWRPSDVRCLLWWRFHLMQCYINQRLCDNKFCFVRWSDDVLNSQSGMSLKII